MEVPEWAEGCALPKAPGSGRERVITEWDSQFEHIGMKLRSIARDGWLCTAYEAGPMYEGTEGELYNLGEDPLQWRNLWDDPCVRATRRRPDRGSLRLSSRIADPHSWRSKPPSDGLSISL